MNNRFLPYFFLLLFLVSGSTVQAAKSDSILVWGNSIYSFFQEDTTLYQKKISILTDSISTEVRPVKTTDFERWKEHPDRILSLDSILFTYTEDLTGKRLATSPVSELFFYAVDRVLSFRHYMYNSDKRFIRNYFRQSNLWKKHQVDGLPVIAIYNRFYRKDNGNLYFACEELLIPLKNGNYYSSSYEISNEAWVNENQEDDLFLQSSRMKDVDVFCINNKYGLYTGLGREIYPAVYDSIQKDRYFLFGYQGKNISLLDYYGNCLKTELKAAKGLGERYQVIDNQNRMYYVDTKGKEYTSYNTIRMSVDDILYDISPGAYLFPKEKYKREQACWVEFRHPWDFDKGKATKQYREANWWEFMIDTIATYGLEEMMYKYDFYKEGFTYYDIKPYFIPDEYKDLRLANNEQTFCNSGDYNQLPKDWIIAKKRGKYGVIRILYDYRVEEVLPFTYNEITGDYHWFKHFLLLERKGLKCYYPISDKPRYKKLEPFTHYFARFQLPNGQWGWLDWDGNEYLD